MDKQSCLVGMSKNNSFIKNLFSENKKVRGPIYNYSTDETLVLVLALTNDNKKNYQPP